MCFYDNSFKKKNQLSDVRTPYINPSRRRAFKISFLRLFFLAIAFQACLFLQAYSFPLSNGNQKKTEQTDGVTTDLSIPFSRCWEYKTDRTPNQIIASDNVTKIIIPLSDGKLELIDAVSGTRIWTSELGGEIASNLAVDDTNIFVVVKSLENYQLRSVSKITGITAWQTKIDTQGKSVDDAAEIYLHFFENKLVSVFRADGNIYAFAPGNGELIWKTRIGQALTTNPAFAGNKIFTATIDKKLSVISLENGERLRDSAASIQISAIANQSPNRIFLGAIEGFVSAIDSASNVNLWKTRTGGARISDITPTPSGLLVSSFDNFLYLLSANSGRRIWKRRLSGRISYKPTVSGGYAVVSTSFNSSAAIVDLKTGKIVNRIVLEEDNIFTGGILLGENRIIVSTLKGMTAFTSKPGKC